MVMIEPTTTIFVTFMTQCYSHSVFSVCKLFEVIVITTSSLVTTAAKIVKFKNQDIQLKTSQQISKMEGLINCDLVIDERCCSKTFETCRQLFNSGPT